MLAIALFVLLSTLYNIWSELTAYNLIRRSVATFATGTLLFGVAILFRPSRQAVYLSVAWLLVGLLFIANLIYTKYAGGFLAASTISYINQLADTGGSIRTLLDVRLMAFFVPSILFAILVPVLRKYVINLEKVRRPLVVIAALLLIIVLGYGYVAYQEYRQYGDISRITNQPIDSSEVVKKVGIINYSIIDLLNFLHRKKSLTEDEVRYVQTQAGKIFVPAAGQSNLATGKLAGKSVIFLQLESFQQFVIGRKINNQELTPNLNKLAASSFNFANFHYVVGPGTSSDAEFVTFTSLLNLANQAVVWDYPANEYDAYPEAIHRIGYATVAYHADSKNFWNRANAFPNFGIQQYVAEDDFAEGEQLGYGLNDREFFKQTAAKISALPRPFYAHVISLSSHSPFEIPAVEQKLDLSGTSLSELQKNYLQAINYTDRAIGEFLEELKKRGLISEIAIIVMGDHEGFIFDKSDMNFARFLGYKNGFTDLTYLQAKQMPFMIHFPDRSLVGVDNRSASQIDIYPTLVNLLGIKAEGQVMGVDLFGSQAATVVRRTRGLGPSIEFVQREQQTYITAALNNKPACYQATNPVSLSNCKELLDMAMIRAQLSDLVIQGNKKLLLKPESNEVGAYLPRERGS